MSDGWSGPVAAALPAAASAAFAILAAAVSGLFAVAVLRRYLNRRRVNDALLAWGVALAFFCGASLALVVGELASWSAASFRAFYLLGGALTVPFLALGTVITLTRDAVTLRLLAVLALSVGIASLVGAVRGAELLVVPAIVGSTWGLVLLSPARLVVAGSFALVVVFAVGAAVAVLTAALRAPVGPEAFPEARTLIPPSVRGFAFAGNVIGGLLLIVGAVVSALRLRGRGFGNMVTGNLLIALGAVVAASTGVFAFLGATAAHAIALALGVTVMYVGFVRTTRPPDLTV